MSRGQIAKLFAVVGVVFTLVGCGGGTDNPNFAPNAGNPNYFGPGAANCGGLPGGAVPVNANGGSYAAILDSYYGSSGNSMTLNLGLVNAQNQPLDYQYKSIAGNAGMVLPDLSYMMGGGNYSFCVSSQDNTSGQLNQGVFDSYSGNIAYMRLSGVLATQAISPFGQAPYGAPGFQQPGQIQTPVSVTLQNVSIAQGRLLGPIIVEIGYPGYGQILEYYADDVLGGGNFGGGSGYYDPTFYW